MNPNWNQRLRHVRAFVSSDVPVRLALLVAALAVAYHYSLGSLLSGWRYQTPLAYLGLVPVLAAALFVAAALRHRHLPSVSLARKDVYVALVCGVLALLVLTVAPALLGNYFWPMRLDLLTLPLAAAACVALVFGTRALVAFVFPLAFLLLAWPLPYTILLEKALAAMTDATAAATAAIAALLGLAHAAPGAGASLLVVSHAGEQFTLSVASACSGLNSAVGFLLVGGASLYLIEGKVRRRLVWFAAGFAVVWLFNLLRVVALVAVARAFGRDVAIDLLHPVAGILALNLAFLLMLSALRPLGLRLRPLRTPARSDTPLAWKASDEEVAGNPSRLRRRLVPLAAAVAVFAAANGQLTSLAHAYDNAGTPTVASFGDSPLVNSAWSAEELLTIDWARPFFGDDSSWVRYRLRPNAASVSATDRFTIWVDSIVTPDLNALLAYPVRRCYDFHDFEIYVDQHVTLGSGVAAQLLAYRDRKGTVWHALTWQWPVQRAGRTVHERIVMLASTQAKPLRPTRPNGRWTIADTLRGGLNRFRPNEDPNRRLASAMRGIADRIIATRVEQGLSS